MITHLISCTEFVKLVHKEEFEVETSYRQIIRYANFISQKPTLEMFVGEKALFKGYTYKDLGGGKFVCSIKKNGFNQFILNKQSLEEIVNLELELAPLALKEIYGN